MNTLVRSLPALFAVALLGCPAQPTAAPLPSSPTPATTARQIPVTPDVKLVSFGENVQGWPACLLWADPRGSSFFALDGAKGVLRRISVPDLKVVQEKDYKRKAAWLAPSAAGLVLSVPDRNEVWLVDPTTLEVTRTIAVDKLQRAVSAAPLSVAFAAADRGDALHVIDLASGQVKKYQPTEPNFVRAWMDNPAVTPDGKYLFTEGGATFLLRSAVKDGGVTPQEKSPEVGREGRVCISADSRFMCYAVREGNKNATGRGWSTVVFAADSFKKQECVLDLDSHCMPVDWDLVTGNIYTGTPETQLVVYNNGGVKQKDVKVGKGQARQFLAHPEGNKVVVLLLDQLWLVDLTKP
jgi:hypothetical protein